MPDDDQFDEFVDDLLENGEQPPVTTPRQFLAGLEAEESGDRPHHANVILTTTPMVPGKSIAEPKGLVSGRVVKGQGPWKNLKMAFGADSFGGRSKTLEGDFLKMEQECYRQLKIAAFQKGANAVVGVSIQFGETSGEADLFYAIATGTAVVAE